MKKKIVGLMLGTLLGLEFVTPIAPFANHVDAKVVDVTSAKKKEVGKGTTNHELGQFANVQKNQVKSQLVRANITPTAETPRTDFIDVSSWNSWMTQSDYNELKRQGVKGAVVKLTEGVNYLNPYAAQQISYAKNAGMVVSTYHFSRFKSNAEAVKEADFYANAAKNLGLPGYTIMVNDAEDQDLLAKNADPTQTSIAFVNQLKAKGYPHVRHYSSSSWIGDDVKPLEPKYLGGMVNFWVANYPSKPLLSSLVSPESAAWQWGSTIVFPGLTKANVLDVNMDYTGYFTGAKDYKSIYFMSNPGKIGFRKETSVYKDQSLKTVVRKSAEGSVATVVEVIKNQSAETSVMKLSTGEYITGNREYSAKFLANTSNYYTNLKTGQKLAVKKGTQLAYGNTSFTGTKTSYVTGTVLTVKGISYSYSGIPQIKLSNNKYITANKTYVTTVTSKISGYNTKPRPAVGAKKAIYVYSDVDLKKKKKVFKKGWVYKSSGIVYSKDGYPRYKVSGGYVTANNIYAQPIYSISGHQTTTKTYTAKTSFNVYSSTDLTKKKAKYKKGTKVKMSGLTFGKTGYLRFKVNGGYVSSSKDLWK
ncbi:MAG: DUF5776 domain-containing protein [Streptococcaceae bacterium]|jgi:GH25 family lysozyme M1 (1,4-beta-N-acetylmuramidase)|nr:DUF5776 domain-containing protein [Streptococcaceae bacterium]